MVNVIVNRGKVVELSELPELSIALDGYVQGPALDLRNKRVSFDHHARCERHATKATCEQVLEALMLGFDVTGYTVYVNDVDADTVLSVYLLQNPELWRHSNIRRLVAAVGAIDAHGPSYPLFGEDERLAKGFFEGVMRPFREMSPSQYAKCDLVELLNACLDRCPSYYEQTAPQREYAVYEIVASHPDPGVVMVKSKDFVFGALYAQGHTRVIEYYELADGSYAYTIGKKSAFVTDFSVGPADVPGTILHALAQVEPGWGGATTIGGAPRNADGSRSRLPPARVLEIVLGAIEAERAAHRAANTVDMDVMLPPIDRILAANRGA